MTGVGGGREDRRWGERWTGERGTQRTGCRWVRAIARGLAGSACHRLVRLLIYRGWLGRTEGPRSPMERALILWSEAPEWLWAWGARLPLRGCTLDGLACMPKTGGQEGAFLLGVRDGVGGLVLRHVAAG